MNRNKKIFYTLTVIFNIVIVILARVSSYLYTVSATDISYPEIIYTLFSYLSEITVNARVIFGFASVSFALYRFGKREMYTAAVISLAASFADHIMRFVIDFFMNAIVDMVLMSLIWLLLNFLYESVFLALAVIISVLMHNKYMSVSGKINGKKYSETRSVYASAALILISKIAIELIYLADFLSTYANITGPEIASIVGQFLQILIIYGGIPIILCELYFAILEKSHVKSA